LLRRFSRSTSRRGLSFGRRSLSFGRRSLTFGCWSLTFGCWSLTSGRWSGFGSWCSGDRCGRGSGSGSFLLAAGGESQSHQECDQQILFHLLVTLKFDGFSDNYYRNCRQQGGLVHDAA
jgi:hypothetical protein